MDTRVNLGFGSTLPPNASNLTNIDAFAASQGAAASGTLAPEGHGTAVPPNKLMRLFSWSRPTLQRSQSSPSRPIYLHANDSPSPPPTPPPAHLGHLPRPNPRPSTGESQATLSPASKLTPGKTPPRRPFFRRKSASVRQKQSLSPLASPTPSSPRQSTPPTSSPKTRDYVAATLEEDATPLSGNGNDFFNVQTPLANPPPVPALTTLIVLSSFLLQPTALTLLQLAPASVVTCASEQPYVVPNHDAPSTTSLSTYVSDHGTGSSAAPRSIAPSLVAPSSGFTEQLAASSLSMPTVSVAAIWRAIKSLGWIHENIDKLATPHDSYITFAAASSVASQFNSQPSGATVFEIGALLQSIMDVLSSYSASLGVELVLYHGLHPSTTMDEHHILKLEGGLCELTTEGDELGLGVTLLTILCQVLSQAQHGESLEVGMTLRPLFTANAPMRPGFKRRDTAGTSTSRFSALSGLSEEESEMTKTWQVSIEIRHNMQTIPVEPMVDALRQPAVPSLAKLFNLIVTPVEQIDARRIWTIEGHFTQHGKDAHKRRGVSELSRDPTVAELFKFAETALKGKKVVIHSSEQSMFAKHLTSYLTSWGMEPHHIGVIREPRGSDGSPEISQVRTREESSRKSESVNGSEHAGPSTEGSQSGNSGSQRFGNVQPDTLDPSVSFLFIDDDVSTLRKQLILIKNAGPAMHLQQAYLNKRSGLGGRRSRSNAQIRPTNPSASLAIIYFTSLSKFRYIRELVQSIFRSVSHMFPLPEVLVLPKPVGPRRLLTALHTAVRRPILDPAVAPIATSPSSPGGHFFFTSSARPSPAPSNQQEFELAFAEAGRVADIKENSISPRSGVLALSTSDPPSPRPSAEAIEYIEYMSKTASDLGSASSGIVVQSPDGKASGLFFQPARRQIPNGPREKRGSVGSNLRAMRQETSDSFQLPMSDTPSPELDGTAPQFTAEPTSVEEPSAPATLSSLPPLNTSLQMVSTRQFGLGQVGRESSSNSAPGEYSARAISLEEYASPTTESETPLVPPPFLRLATAPAATQNPRSPIQTGISPPVSNRSTSSPTSAPARDSSVSSPILSASPLSTALKAPKPAAMRRRESKAGKGARPVPTKKASNTVVPPINVLIVEDNPINLTIMSTFLKRKGIKHSVANNGQEAVDKWRVGGFHLVLMDIQLPVKSGIEATREIREIERVNNIAFQETPQVDKSAFVVQAARPSTTPVSSPHRLPVIIVALTASSSQVDRIAALAAGCNDFLTKPVSLPWFQQKLLEWGSMSILSSFSIRRRDTLAATPITAGYDFDRSAAANKASEIASHLHIERHKSIPSNSGLQPAEGAPSAPSTGEPEKTLSEAVGAVVLDDPLSKSPGLQMDLHGTDGPEATP